LPAAPPRPDQFVYTGSQTADGPREAWLSADGAHDGLIRQEPQPADGNTVTLVFDSATHAFLGITDQSAVLDHTVVDRAGQRP
jgi:hypothetical protein